MAARGIDVPSLTHVVNLDVPSSLEQYVHRAGRAGESSLSHAALCWMYVNTPSLFLSPTTPTHHATTISLGRAGRPGIVLSFSPPSTAYILDKFAKKLGLRLERVDIAHGCVPVTA